MFKTAPGTSAWCISRKGDEEMVVYSEVDITQQSKSTVTTKLCMNLKNIAFSDKSDI